MKRNLWIIVAICDGSIAGGAEPYLEETDLFQAETEPLGSGRRQTWHHLLSLRTRWRARTCVRVLDACSICSIHSRVGVAEVNLDTCQVLEA